jgi:uncharacterized protein (DUF1501 family)
MKARSPEHEGTRFRRNVSRRRLLAGAGAIAAYAALPRMLFAKTGGQARLVVVILRGALDGLAAVPPVGDPNYAGLRRDIAIAAPGAAGGALPLTATFGLHPSLSFLHERYRAKELVVLHAVASPYRDRSHFDGQAVLENGLTQPLGSADGWLNRALAVLPAPASSAAAERALALSLNVPLILRGPQVVLSKSPQKTRDVDEDLLARLADLYSKDDWFSARLSEAVQSEKLGDANPVSGAPMDLSKPGRLGNARLIQSATLAANLMATAGGPEIAVLEATGWDTHANQGGADGALASRLVGLDNAIRALASGLSELWQSTAVLVVTEFGRTAAVNGTRGTDHGTGTCCFLIGGAVAGGRVVADWPGLGPSDLFEGRDLRPTQDLRSVFKSVLADHLRVDHARIERTVFPDSSRAELIRDLIRA